MELSGKPTSWALRAWEPGLDFGYCSLLRLSRCRYNRSMADPIVRTIAALTHGRFLIDVPPDVAPPYRLLVGFHGYGEDAERHLERLRRIPGASGWLLAAVQGLHRFYSPRRPEDVVASWMTWQDREQAITDNIAYIDAVLAAIVADYPIVRLVFAGFSQGVAMAYRAAVFGASRSQGVIALGGDVPPDVLDGTAKAFPPVLIGRGAQDTWYTDQRLGADVADLQAIGVAVRTVVVEGGHGWSEAFGEVAGEFLMRVATKE
jgi:predicted esterase